MKALPVLTVSCLLASNRSTLHPMVALKFRENDIIGIESR